MPDSNANFIRNVYVSSLVLLFIFGFWQSWSGAFIFATGFIHGGVLMILTEKNKHNR